METDSKQFEKSMARDAIIIAVVALVLVVALVIWGIKIILEG